MLRVYGYVVCSIFLLSVYMCVRMLSSPKSIVGVPSSRALPGFPVNAPPPVCAPAVIGALAVWRQIKTKKTGGYAEEARVVGVLNRGCVHP